MARSEGVDEGAGLAPISFIFGGNTELTYEELKKRRAIAAALAARQKGFPKNIGEGLTYLGESIGEAGLNWRLAQAEKAQQLRDQGVVGGAPGGPGYVTAQPPGARPATPAAAPAAAPAAGPPRQVSALPAGPPPAGAPAVAATDETQPSDRPPPFVDGRPNNIVTRGDPSLFVPHLGPIAPEHAPAAYAPEAAGIPPRAEGEPLQKGDRLPMMPPPMEGEGVPYFGETRRQQIEQNALPNEPAAPPEDRLSMAEPPIEAEPTALAATSQPQLPPGVRAVPRYSEDPATGARSQVGVRFASDGSNPDWRTQVSPEAREWQRQQIADTLAQGAGARGAEPGISDGGYNMIDAQVGYRRPTPGYIQDAIQRNVRDPDRQAYLGSLVGGEAPKGPRDTSPTGAAGPFQFTRGTGRQYGLMGPGGDRREDLDASTIAANRLTDDNVAAFRSRLGRDPTPAEMALLHQQGGVTGSRMVAGTGNASPQNLRVNNVPPNATPQQAAARIQAYYGMPNEPRGGGGGGGGDVQVAQAPPPQQVAQAPRPAAVVGGAPGTGRDAIAAALVAQGGEPPPREASQSFTDPAGQEVPQANPTQAGVMPPQTTSGARPAAASSIPILAASGEEEQSPFDRLLGQRQAPAMVAGDQPLGPAVPAPNDAIQRAPNAPPSREPIPGASVQEMTPPGDRPPPPDRLLPSEQQVYWQRVLASPNYSDTVKEHAKRQIAVQEAYRKEHQERIDEEYRHVRGRHDKRSDEYEKWVREAPDRDIKQLADRLAIQKAQAEAERQPAEALRLRLEIDKLHKELTSPHRVTVGGTQFEQPYVGPGQPQQPYRVSPGLPQPEEKPLTVEQAKAAEFVARTAGDLKRLEELNHGEVLTKPAEALRGNIPFVGNITATPAYRQAVNAANNWGAGFLTHVSGAAVSAPEAARNLPAFMPMAGDDKDELIEKSRRRKDFTEAVARSSGERGMAAIREQIERQNAAYMARKPIVDVASPEEASNLPAGTRIRTPDGREGVVPLKIIVRPERR